MTPDEMDQKISVLLERFIVALESIAQSYAKSVNNQIDALNMSKEALAKVQQ